MGTGACDLSHVAASGAVVLKPESKPVQEQRGLDGCRGKTGRLKENRWGSYLLALANRVDCGKMAPPKFLIVVAGGQYAYTRSDGIYVVPIGCLGARRSRFGGAGIASGSL